MIDRLYYYYFIIILNYWWAVFAQRETDIGPGGLSRKRKEKQKNINKKEEASNPPTARIYAPLILHIHTQQENEKQTRNHDTSGFVIEKLAFLFLIIFTDSVHVEHFDPFTTQLS